MTNYERLQDTLIEKMIKTDEICQYISSKRFGAGDGWYCPAEDDKAKDCNECEMANKRWLLRDVDKFDWETLKPGTKVEADSNTIDAIKGMFLEIVYSKDETFWMRRWFDDGTYRDFIQTIEELDSNYKNVKEVKE